MLPEQDFQQGASSSWWRRTGQEREAWAAWQNPSRASSSRHEICVLHWCRGSTLSFFQRRSTGGRQYFAQGGTVSRFQLWYSRAQQDIILPECGVIEKLLWQDRARHMLYSPAEHLMLRCSEPSGRGG